jgi:hypothetical protein
MSDDFYCKICSIACNGTAPYEQHVVSIKHLKKAKLHESQTSSEQSTPSNTNTPPLTITTRTLPPSPNTRAPITTTNNAILEASSVPSVFVPISPETMRILLEWNHPLGYKPYCDICQLPLHGDKNADVHFNANNNLHNQKLAAWKQIRENDAKYSCKVCSEIFSNENQMREHFNSDSHGNTIDQKIYLEKFILIYQTYNKLKQARREAIGI